MFRKLGPVSVPLFFIAIVISAGCSTIKPEPDWSKPCKEMTCTGPNGKLVTGVANFAEVTDTGKYQGKLWRGAQPDPSANGFTSLEAAGVKTIVNLRHDHDDFPFLRNTKMNYLWLPSRATRPLETNLVLFLKLFDLLKDEKYWPVFVHCAEGKDRTGYAIATFRIVNQNWSPDKAIHEMSIFGHNPDNPFLEGDSTFLRKLNPIEFNDRVKIVPF